MELMSNSKVPPKSSVSFWGLSFRRIKYFSHHIKIVFIGKVVAKQSPVIENDIITLITNLKIYIYLVLVKNTVYVM